MTLPQVLVIDLWVKLNAMMRNQQEKDAKCGIGSTPDSVDS